MDPKPSFSVPKQETKKTKDTILFDALKDSIRSRRCNVKELRIALQQGLITDEEHVLLLEYMAGKLEGMVGIDPLTNVFNRAFLEPQLYRVKEELNHKPGEREVQMQSVMVIYLDIKDFKELNDTYGHSAGDKALIALADNLKGVTKRGDMIFRIGGDEFIAVLPINDKNLGTYTAIFERIKNGVNTKVPIGADNANVDLNVTMGYEILNRGDDTTAAQLLDKADKKMYQEKKNSRRKK